MWALPAAPVRRVFKSQAATPGSGIDRVGVVPPGSTSCKGRLAQHFSGWPSHSLHIKIVLLCQEINTRLQHRICGCPVCRSATGEFTLNIESFKKKMARPERFELPTLCFEGRCSIQLSYGRADYMDSKSSSAVGDTVLRPVEPRRTWQALDLIEPARALQSSRTITAYSLGMAIRR